MNAPVALPNIKFKAGVIPEEQRAKIYEYLNEPGWETGWRSNSKRDAFSFLHKHFAGHRKKDGNTKVYDCDSELLVNAPPVWTMWRDLKDVAFAGHTLVRCYANGMMYGMDGTVHTDSRRPGSFTAVYYPHDRWSPNWGGETLFYNEQETGILGVCYPVPNSMVMFEGRIPHRANGVTRQYPGMRITLMFKTELTNGNALPDVSD